MTSSVVLVGAIDALLPGAHNPSRRDTPNCTDTSENHLVHTALAPSQTGLLCEGTWQFNVVPRTQTLGGRRWGVPDFLIS